MNRTPVKIRRTPAKIKKTSDETPQSSVYSKLFPSISTPRQKARTSANLSGLDLSSISDAQIRALQEENLALWALTIGIEVDHKPFDFERHKYLLPLYLDNSQEIVLMKSAQMGATIWMLLRLIHFTLHNNVKACLYFPTQDAVSKLSRDRLTPLIHSNKTLSKYVQDTDTIGYKKIGEKSSLYLQHMGGEATKDSTPFDMLCFDEVRLIKPADIDQAQERLSHSEYKYIMKVSTAGMPAMEPALSFGLGTMNYWHIHCDCTGQGLIPSERWPDCIDIINNPKKKEIFLRCPKCHKRIYDAQDGQFIPHNPNANFPSYHISQFLSKFISVAEIWDAWQRTKNIKEFYNAKLGKPYVDEENQPVKDDDLAACENPILDWGKSKPEHGGKIQRAMGVDQMGGNNYVVIIERHANKKRVVHLEIIDSRNPIYMEDGKRVTPFKRLYPLMHEWDMDLCIIDAMPNINEAVDFANTFPRRVFVGYYVESMGGAQSKDLVQWGDRAKHKVSVKKGGPKIKFKWTATLNRYMSLDFVLSEIVNRNFEWPIPEKLIQVERNPNTGLFEPLHIARTHFYEHLKALIRQKTIINEEAGTFKMEWISAIDPHFIHALNLGNIALERLMRQPIILFAG